MGYVIAVQPNGERLTYEAWVVRDWQRGLCSDPVLIRGLNSAVQFIACGAATILF